MAVRPPTPMARRAVLEGQSPAEHDDHAEAGAERAVGQLDFEAEGVKRRLEHRSLLWMSPVLWRRPGPKHSGVRLEVA